jgi:hypothetical protein
LLSQGFSFSFFLLQSRALELANGLGLVLPPFLYGALLRSGA